MRHLVIESSSPKEWGQQHGESFKTEIQELAKIRMDLLRSYLSNWSIAQIESLAQSHIVRLKKDITFYEEFKGLQQATGISETELLVLNGYTDLRDFSHNDQAKTEDGCSAWSVRNTEHQISGQTWDMHASARPYVLHLEFKNPQPMHILTVTGCFGLAGVNSHGLTVLINNMHCKETAMGGLVWTALVRKMLEQETALMACKVLQANIPSSGHNYLLADSTHTINVETTGLRTEITHNFLGSGLALHTNHYLGKLRSEEILERQSPSTHKRMKALEDYFNKEYRPSLSEPVFRESLMTSSSCAQEISIPYKNDPAAGMTCGGLWVNHRTRQAVAFGGLYAENDHHHLTFTVRR